MCLYVKNNVIEDLKVADKPIRVYKIMIKDNKNEETHYLTPFTRTPCEIGCLLNASKPHLPIKDYIETVPCSIEGEGVHAYLYKNLAVLEGRKLLSPNKLSIGEWEIPAGAKFWLGARSSEGEIASTEMKFIKVIENYTSSKINKIASIDALLSIEYADVYLDDSGEFVPRKREHKNMNRLFISSKKLSSLIPKKIKTHDKTYTLTVSKVKNYYRIGYYEPNKRYYLTSALTVNKVDGYSSLFSYLKYSHIG